VSEICLPDWSASVTLRFDLDLPASAPFLMVISALGKTSSTTPTTSTICTGDVSPDCKAGAQTQRARAHARFAGDYGRASTLPIIVSKRSMAQKL
jgi:hypothetical protein